MKVATRVMVVSLLLSTVSLFVGRGDCYPGELMDRLPKIYQEQLELLKMVLALNVEWSAVWSEKLIVDTMSVPNPERCVRLIEPEAVTSEEAIIDPFDVVKKIVDKCSYSGQYVDYGAQIVGHSVLCYFYRNALLHVSAVRARISDMTPEFVDYLKQLVNDYKLIVDKLAAIDVSLRTAVELATFLYDVVDVSAKLAEQTPQAENLQNDWEKRVAGVFDALSKIFGAFCITDNNDWYDDDKNEIVSLKPIKPKKKKKDKKKKEKKKEKKKDKKDEEDDQEKKEKKSKEDEKEGEKKEEEKKEKKEKKKEKDKDKDEEKDEKKEKDKKEDGKDSILRLNNLRLIMLRVFDRLIVSKMPDKFWKEIFTQTIFIKSSAFQVPDTKAQQQPKGLGGRPRTRY